MRILDSIRLSRRSMFKSALAAGVAMTVCAGSAMAADVELNFWDMNWGAPEYAVAAQKLVDRYNAEHKDVKINYRSVSWTGWYETFVTAIASGSAPDLSTGAGFQAVELYSQDAILPIDDLIAEMEKDGSAGDFTAGTLDAMKYDGHYVGLPWGIDVRVMLYRDDILKAKGIKLPTNWDEFRAAAKAATGDGVYGYVSAGDSSGVHSIYAAAINNGGGLFDASGKPGLTSPETMQALEFLSGLTKDGSVNPASVGYGTNDRQDSFYKGKAAFTLDTPGVADGAGAARDKIKILAPLKSPSGKTGTVEWVNNLMVYKQTQHPKETLAFLKWWSDNEKVLWTEGHAGSIPARKSFAADAYFQTNANLKYAIDTYLPIAKPMSAVKGGTFPQLNTIDGESSLTTLVQQIWQGQTPADAVKPAQARLEEIMSQ